MGEPRVRRLGIVAAAVAAVLIVAPARGFAQLPPLPPVPSLLPSAAPPPPTTAPPPPSDTSPPDSPSDSPSTKPDESDPDSKPTDTPSKFRFTLGGPKNTSRLVAILSELTKLGIPLSQALTSGTGRMPVAGLAYWSDDWHAYRCCPTPHQHQGLDIFAPKNAPALAVTDGVIYNINTGNSAGKSTYLRDDHGTNYYYFHLNKWPKGLHIGQRVKRGQVIGYVGNTGNAIHTPDHIHFEIHPGGGTAVAPKPYVDRWLQEAIRESRLLIARLSDQLAAADRVDFRLRRSFDLMGEGGVSGAVASALSAAGYQPGVSSLEVARQTLGQMAWEIDWTEYADAELARLALGISSLSTDVGSMTLTSWGPFGPSLLPIDEAYSSGYGGE